MPYEIIFGKNVNYPDVTSEADFGNIINDESIIAAIDEVLDNGVGLAGFTSTLTKQQKDNYLTDIYKRRLGYTLEFPCDGNKRLGKEKYGDQLRDKICVNGKYLFSGHLKDGRFMFEGSDICAGATEGKPPNMTLRVADISKVVLPVAFYTMMTIQFSIKCGDDTVIFNMPAFVDSTNTPTDVGLFLSSKLDDKNYDKVQLYYSFGLDNAWDTILTRKKGLEIVKPKPWTPISGTAGSPTRITRFYWETLPGQPTLDQISTATTDSDNWYFDLNSGTGDTEDDFKEVVFDPETGKPTLGNGIPWTPAVNSRPKTKRISDRINELLKNFLSSRIHQLKKTLKQEINYVPCDDNCQKARDLLNDETKNLKIMVEGFESNTSWVLLYNKNYYSSNDEVLNGIDNLLEISENNDFELVLREPQVLERPAGGIF